MMIDGWIMRYNYYVTEAIDGVVVNVVAIGQKGRENKFSPTFSQ
jgi:hypothetical protein